MGYLKSWNGRNPEYDSEVRHKIELREERHLSDTKITRGSQKGMQLRAHGTCIVANKEEWGRVAVVWRGESVIEEDRGLKKMVLGKGGRFVTSKSAPRASKWGQHGKHCPSHSPCRVKMCCIALALWVIAKVTIHVHSSCVIQGECPACLPGTLPRCWHWAQ